MAGGQSKLMHSQELPPGTTPTDITPSGASYWARTAKISATDADGEEAEFFIKARKPPKFPSLLCRIK